MYTDKAVAVLNEKFVCFAPGWFINSDDDVYKAAWKRFYASKPNPDEGDGWLKGTQLVLMTSAGHLLHGSMKYGDRKGLDEALQQVLDAYAKLPESKRRPPSPVEGEAKPVPAPPPGGLVLTVYDRPLSRDEEGKYQLPCADEINKSALHLAAPAGQRSSLWLSAEEVASLIPGEPKKDLTFPVPEKLARRILIYGLWPNSLWVVEVAWPADALRSGGLEMTVLDVSPEKLRMRIHGAAQLQGTSGHGALKGLPIHYDPRIEGVVEYDRQNQKITRFDVVALGNYMGEWFAEDGGRWRAAKATDPLALAFAFEIDQTAYQAPASRRRPRSFVHAYIFKNNEQHYWDPIQWEADWRKRQKQ